MPLGVGTRLGPYEIQTALGAGGMGEVYKATDTRLGRTVAIKVLPPHVANDAELRRRFEREARTISSLNHPHICALYDVGSQDGVDFLVMEYVDGETQYEIYVQPFPSGPRMPISSGGGAQVRRSRDGKELFYISLDGRLMAVPIWLGRSDEAPEVGVPVALFATNLGGAIVQGVTRQQYDVSRDGRFLMNTLVEDPNASPITLILNWTPKP